MKSPPTTTNEGSVLFFVLAILASLSVVCGTVYVVTKTDMQISANYKSFSQAFGNADGAVQYVKNEVNKDLAGGTLTLNSAVESVNYTAPSGYEFDPIIQLTQVGNTNAWMFEVTGHALTGRATLRAVLGRKKSLAFGVFGDEEADMKAYGNIYSYYSTTTPNPTPSDSTGEAATASNEEFITHMGMHIDGDLALGEDSMGSTAIWSSTGTPDITGEEGLEVGRIDPDPLGAIGGNLAALIAAAKTANDNATASPPITGKKINLNNGDVMTLTTGNYYLTDATLKNGSSLIIDNTTGLVTIYLEGGVEAKNGSSINILGNPTDFAIYSNSDEDIIFKHGSTIKGLVYAPYATVEVKNSADFYGLVWAEAVDIKNSGDFYIDLSLTGKFFMNEVELVAWKHVRK